MGTIISVWSCRGEDKFHVPQNCPTLVPGLHTAHHILRGPQQWEGTGWMGGRGRRKPLLSQYKGLMRRHSRVTTGISAFPLGWPWEAQSSPRVARESWGLRSSHCRADETSPRPNAASRGL